MVNFKFSIKDIYMGVSCEKPWLEEIKHYQLPNILPALGMLLQFLQAHSSYCSLDLGYTRLPATLCLINSNISQFGFIRNIQRKYSYYQEILVSSCLYFFISLSYICIIKIEFTFTCEPARGLEGRSRTGSYPDQRDRGVRDYSCQSLHTYLQCLGVHRGQLGHTGIDLYSFVTCPLSFLMDSGSLLLQVLRDVLCLFIPKEQTT